MKNKKIYFLITAYYVEGNSSRRKLRKKYENRLLNCNHRFKSGERSPSTHGR